MSTAEDRMRSYQLVATAADLKGFRHLAPVGGFDEAHAAYFFKLRCSSCAEITVKEVCLHPPGPEWIGSSCSYRVRASSSARFVRENCFPTCANPAHLVRKCKGCGLLGSVELIPGFGTPINSGTNVLMLLECIGYTPLNFWPGADWTLTTMAGDEIAVKFAGDSFVSSDDGADTSTVIKGVRFSFKGTTDVQVE